MTACPLALLIAASTSTASLSLEDAIQLALDNNEVPQIAQLRIERAQATRSEAYALLFPTLSLSATYTRRAREVAPTIGTERAVIQSPNALGAETSLSATLFDARTIPIIKKANEDVKAQELESDEMRRNLTFGVAEAFYTALTAERTRRAAHRRVELATHVVSNVSARFSAGLANRHDVNRSELELASARLAETKAGNAVRLSRLALGFLTDHEVTVSLREPQIPAPVIDDVKPLVRRAMESRPDLAALQSRAVAARHAADEPWMRLIPSLGVVGRVRATNETGFQDEVFNWDVAATLDWALYDGGVRYAQAAALETVAREIELQVSVLKRRIRLEVRSATTNVTTARAAVEQARERVRVASNNSKEVRARYAQGLAGALEQADAAVSEFEASTDLERQRFEVAVAHLLLLKATGSWPMR